MKEITFLKQNESRWREFEQIVTGGNTQNPDKLGELFVQLTDDLSYARTFYPKSKTTKYLNELAAKAHQQIYKNKKENTKRIITFWKSELPLVMYSQQKIMLLALLIFIVSAGVGVLSQLYDDSFVRIILGDTYVNMTLNNIENSDPMAVYKQMKELDMFLAIALNNVMVSFLFFILGMLFAVGAIVKLFETGVMIGCFFTLFYQHDALTQAMLTVWIHGVIEICIAVIACGAGIMLGKSYMFPGTYSRSVSFMNGVKKGIKILVGLVPLFIFAAFLEGFVTRHTEMPLLLSLFIIFGSLTFIVWYFVLYPMKQYKLHGTN